MANILIYSHRYFWRLLSTKRKPANLCYHRYTRVCRSGKEATEIHIAHVRRSIRTFPHCPCTLIMWKLGSFSHTASWQLFSTCTWIANLLFYLYSCINSTERLDCCDEQPINRRDGKLVFTCTTKIRSRIGRDWATARGDHY